MSGDRRDEHRNSRGMNPNDRNLPPIREVFRDELDRPARPSPYSFGDVRGALPVPESPVQHNSWGHSGRNEPRGASALPPIQHQSYSASRAVADARISSAQRRYSSQAPPSPSLYVSHSGRDRPRAAEDPGYSYGVLRTSGTSGEFVNAIPPSHQPQGILRQTAAPAEGDQDLSKRYRCEVCGKRFGMPSHLEIHIRTHTAQRPFACYWPDCDRTFSVRSNMMRHYRSHGMSTGSGYQSSERSKDEYEDDGTGEDQYSREGSSSSKYFHTASSSHQSSSQYYSSSRRK